MAKKSVKGKKTRRPTKSELAQREQVIALWTKLGLLVLLGFGATRMGVVGLLIYNGFRFFFGSTTYLVMGLLLLALVLPKKYLARKGLLFGIVLVLMGLLLEFQAYFALQSGRLAELSRTFQLAWSELSRFQVTRFLGGGVLGAALFAPISVLFDTVGTFFIGGILLVLGGFLVSPWSTYDVADFLAVLGEKNKVAAAKRAEKKQERRAIKEAQRLERQQEKEEQAAQRAAEEARRQAEVALLAEQEEPTSFPESDVPVFLEEDETPVEPTVSLYDETDEFPVRLILEEEEPDQPVDDEPVEIDFRPKTNVAYRLPSIDLFAPVRSKSQAGEKKIVRENIAILEQTFASFGIKVAVERAEIGPSVTKYEVKPAVGVRVNRISNLADDLALALAAKDVRIEAPIPGKSLVGIEVPNSEIATVSFRELWEQSKTNPANLLEIPLGKAVNGQSRSFDLARMPHLLVAGSTGSGKSVAVNGIIASILMKAGPDQVKFMMIDPKMVELSVYNDIPHLLIPVVTNPRKAARALQKVVDEMEKRYELFSQIGVRNIAGYNAKVEEFNAKSQEKQIPLPLIVVIVDELADLMMVASKEVEDAIIRLGQKARAAGIHMILATQRPSVDVISGLIKANVPSRVAFAVSSGTDSRTILDENGAEKLLGRGDMLFKPIDENHPVRLQGSFISDEEVERLVDFVKGQGEAEYDAAFDPGEVSESDGDSMGSDDNGSDPLFEEARALVVETQKASASMIQRRLSVGFNRATRLMEELEAAGVIGPAEGTKPRKVLETQ